MWPSVRVEAHVDGQYERFGRVLKRGRTQDFLLLHATTSVRTQYLLREKLELELLLLYWENGAWGDCYGFGRLGRGGELLEGGKAKTFEFLPWIGMRVGRA
jgi:hypothetical protein